MNRLFTLIPILLFSLSSFAQTRIFISGGASLNTNYEPSTFYSQGIGNALWKNDGSYITKGLSRYWTFDVEVERKFSKLYFVSGAHLFKSGYSNNMGTNFSTLDCTHLGIPLLVRLNMLNYGYLDIGVLGVINLNATLEETALKGSSFQKYDKQNIAPYLSPFKIGMQLQYSIVINRYLITGYFTKVVVSVDEALNSNWNLGGNYKNNSLFLRDMGSSYRIFLMGLKLGMRIK